MLASSFGDPVLGLDIHWEMVPMPAPVPTPLPNPFIGVIFDPMGLAAGIAIGAAIGAVMGEPFKGPVIYWKAFPATNTGTEAKGVGHIIIPPGTAWAPVPRTPKPVIHPGETPKPAPPIKPEDDAICIFGSKTVSVMGSNAVRIGDISLSCSEPVRLPSSAVIAIPKGAPILIGGPPSLDLMAAVLGSLRTRFVSDSLHAMLSRLKPGRFRNILNKIVCFFTGHPVDVASGKMITSCMDVELPGPMPLKIERNYSSAFASRNGPLGFGWSHSLDQAVWRERGKVVYLAEDGREIEFDTFDFPGHNIQPGQELWNPINQLTLHCKNDNHWEIVTHDGVVHEFSPMLKGWGQRSLLRRISSRCGFHEIRLLYGDKGHLDAVKDSAGRILYFEHDQQGRLLTIILPHPTEQGTFVQRSYQYNHEGDLVKVTDPLEASWNFEYVTHLMTRETNRNGLSFYFAYDGMGEDAWCIRTWGDGGIYDHVISYDKKNHVTYVKNSLGHTTQYFMNIAGLVVKVVDPLGGEKSYGYDPDTLQKTVYVDALGNESYYEYDERGNSIKVTGPDSAELIVSYDRMNNPTQVKDAIGGVWHWSSDFLGRLVCQTNPMGDSIQYEYDEGHLVTVTESSGKRTQLSYDSQSNITSIQGIGGSDSRWDYDGLGRATSATDLRGNVEQRLFDLHGQVKSVQTPDGSQRTLDYDSEGNVVQFKDNQRNIVYSYSGRGRLSKSIEGGTAIQLDYDSEERLVSIQNEHGNTYRYELTENGDVAKEVGFDGIQRRIYRDAAGRIEKIERASGLSTSYTYNTLGKITKIQHSDGTFEEYVYRNDGALIKAINDMYVVSFERDLMGRIIKEWQDDYWVESEYAATGLRSRLSSSLGAIQQIKRNTMGDVTQLQYSRQVQNQNSEYFPQQDWEAHFKRDQTGLEIERQLPGGVKSSWQRDKLGRPAQHKILDKNNKEIRNVFYRWDVNNRLLHVRNLLNGTIRYHHDILGNLAAAQYGDGAVELRVPDPVGNLFKTKEQNDRKYGLAGQLLECNSEKGTIYYTYDEEGNLIKKIEPDGGEWHYCWNASGMLIKVVRPDNEEVIFSYDALGRRKSKSFLGKITYWIWDGNNPLHEWTENQINSDKLNKIHTPINDETQPIKKALHAAHPSTGPPPASTFNSDHKSGSNILQNTPKSAIITWLFEPDGFAPIAKIEGNKKYSIVSDYLGIPVAMVDNFGKKVWSANISVYGKLRNLEGNKSECPFRWPGQYEDEETGLYYNRFRYYDPEGGIYVSQDPIGLEGGMNLHAYVHNPNSWTDVLGLAGTGGAYMFGFENGDQYIGKGEAPRMGASIGERSTGSSLTGSAHVSTGGNNELGKMVEHRAMIDAGFTKGNVPDGFLNSHLSGQAAWDANPKLQAEANRLAQKLKADYDADVAKRSGCT